jgi:ABC-type transport system involved in multi-copper enzyme maturation permease subunit
MSGVVLDEPVAPGPPAATAADGHAVRGGSWIPPLGLISTKFLELRRRRGLMIVIFLLTIGLPVLVLGLRLLFHVVDPSSYGPAGSPNVFSFLSNILAEFGFIIGATLGAAAGTTDLSEGVFRQLVVTGRSRLALYLSRIPAGLSILLPLVGVGFGLVCLVTSYAGVPQPTTVGVNGVSIPLQLDKTQLETWLTRHPNQAGFVTASISVSPSPNGGSAVAVQGVGPSSKSGNNAADVARIRSDVRKGIGPIFTEYQLAEITQSNPAINEMVKIGLWLELEVAIGFLVGLGLGSLMGQRTLATILMIVLQLVITPILAANVIPYFINGQRLIVGIALDQLRPIGLGTVGGGPGGPGRVLFGGRGALGIPPMPTWAMIAVIVGWIVVSSVIGAWRMVRRDA